MLLKPAGTERGMESVIDEVQKLPSCFGCSQAGWFGENPPLFFLLLGVVVFFFPFGGMGRGFSLLIHSMKTASPGEAGGSSRSVTLSFLLKANQTHYVGLPPTAMNSNSLTSPLKPLEAAHGCGHSAGFM